MDVSKAGRRKCARGAWLALLVAGLGLSVGCDEEAALRTFRGAAADSLQQGLTAIFDGLIEGAFAVVQMGDDAATRNEQATGGG